MEYEILLHHFPHVIADIIQDYAIIMRCEPKQVNHGHWKVLFVWIRGVVQTLDNDHLIPRMYRFYNAHMQAWAVARKVITRRNYHLFGIALLHMIHPDLIQKNQLELGILEYMIHITTGNYKFLEIVNMNTYLKGLQLTPICDEHTYNRITCIINESCLKSRPSNDFFNTVFSNSVAKNKDLLETTIEWILQLVIFKKIKIKFPSTWKGLGNYYIRRNHPEFPLILFKGVGVTTASLLGGQKMKHMQNFSGLKPAYFRKGLWESLQIVFG
jgi:hypothetical protein